MTNPLPFQFRDSSRNFQGKPEFMGIVNVTPDSFSDGGKFNQIDSAVQHALQLQNEGATFIDIGGESTRPGFQPVTTEEEMRRVLPVIRELHRQCSLPISIDTSHAVVAEEALKAGASIINDVRAFEDPDMPRVAGKFGAGCILMHSESLAPDQDATSALRTFFQHRIPWAIAQSGLKQDHFMTDPGIGFGKNLAQNLQLIKECGVLRSLGTPVLVGMSNKSFIGKITGEQNPAQRLGGTIASAICCAKSGCDILRLHRIFEIRQALQVASALNLNP